MYTVLRCILNVRVSPSLQMLQYSSSPGKKGEGAKTNKNIICPMSNMPMSICQKGVKGREEGGAKYPSPSHYDDNEYQYRY